MSQVTEEELKKLIIAREEYEKLMAKRRSNRMKNYYKLKQDPQKWEAYLKKTREYKRRRQQNKKPALLIGAGEISMDENSMN